MFKVREVIPDKFWIVDDRYGKVGTLRACNVGYEFYDNRTSARTIVDSMDEFQLTANDMVTEGEFLVNGYPTKTIPFPAEHDVLPVYRKTEKGNVLYAAGYYIIKFKDWLPSFSPKVDTLMPLDYRGPYRTEWEMNMELARHKKL